MGKNLKVVVKTNLKIDRINLPRYVTWIPVKVIGEETKIELTFAQCLGVVNSEKPGTAVDRWGLIARIIC
ncbi:MAG: hypothetical protein KA368_06805 [Acidobacteria bacterium]|nr:hypothetical protein [Acidobacteriota bacterium]